VQALAQVLALSAEQAAALLRILPDAEELKQLRAYTGEPAALAEAEALFHGLTAAAPTAAALGARAGAEVARLALLSDAADAAPGEAAAGHLPALLAAARIAAGGGEAQPRLLLVGSDPGGRLAGGIAAAGGRCSRWLRFAREGEAPASVGPPGGPFHGAALRLPPSGEGAAHACGLLAGVLPPGAPLLAYGRADEGGGGPLGQGWRGVLSLGAPGEVVLRMARRSSAGGEEGAREPPALSPLLLPGAARALPWASAPGLFAGGRLDDMSAALRELVLRSGPPARAAPRVLDLCCGSGALAAALAMAWPAARIEAWDAVACACEVAAGNLARACAAGGGGRAGRVRSRDGWGPPSPRCYALILCDPPVHAGAPDDLRLLARILQGARGRLL
jgi:hypothetical protein